MKYLFTKSSLRILKEVATSNVLMAFDYDGTLAPIVKIPEDAEMRQSTSFLLKRLSSICPCIVISGRGRKDVSKFLSGIDLKEIVGNHGIEADKASKKLKKEIKKIHLILEKELPRLPGVHIEDKSYTIAIHYRQSREKKKARQVISKVLTRIKNIRIIEGKQVYDIIPQGAPHKGTALEKLRSRLSCDTSIYLGDDRTDEDVFSMDQPGRLFSIRVGEKKDSAATFYIKRQSEIDRLLRLLIQIKLNNI